MSPSELQCKCFIMVVCGFEILYSFQLLYLLRLDHNQCKHVLCVPLHLEFPILFLCYLKQSKKYKQLQKLSPCISGGRCMLVPSPAASLSSSPLLHLAFSNENHLPSHPPLYFHQPYVSIMGSSHNFSGVQVMIQTEAFFFHCLFKQSSFTEPRALQRAQGDKEMTG